MKTMNNEKRTMNNEKRIAYNGGSLPLAPKVAALRQRFSAAPSAGETPATPPSWCRLEVKI
jgi:hypothetical protein